MVQLESLKIQNFRGFDNLEMKDFSKINVLVGKNNCGKTSVLEAIFLLTGMLNAQLPLHINAMRGLKTHRDSLRYFFHNFITTEYPVFQGILFGKSKQITIKPIFENNEMQNKDEQNSSAMLLSTSAVPQIMGLSLENSIQSQNAPPESFCTNFLLEEKGGVSQIKTEQKINFLQNTEGDVISIFLYSNIKDNGLSNQLEVLVKSKKEQIINDILNKFDPALKSIYPLPNGIYIDKEGVNERIPLNLMGDGVRHFLNMAATIAANQDKDIICLIDEIENGLHYRAQQLTWQSILSLTRTTNVQLFITTHNWETLQSLTNVLKQENYVDMQDSVKVFSIVNTLKEGFQSYAYSYDGLDLAFENLMEIR
jgi:AAA15 family ATPase/GTPase